jgi:sulfonate transport system substrate-binding protein
MTQHWLHILNRGLGRSGWDSYLSLRSLQKAIITFALVIGAGPMAPATAAALEQRNWIAQTPPAGIGAPSPQTANPQQPEADRQLAYPPGTTKGILRYIFVIAGALLFLYLIKEISGHQADRSANASLAKESKKLKQLKIGYPEGMIFMEELRRLKLLESRLSPLGVDIIWSSFPSASTLLSALSKGDIDFCGGGGTASIFSQAAGHLFVRVAREKYPDLQGEAILVPEDSSIHSLPDLKGKKVAFDEGSSAHYVLIRALQIVGLSYGDIQPVPLPQSQALYHFKQGEVDAWVVWMPYAPTEMRRRYPGRSIADLFSILGDKAAAEVPTLYYCTPELASGYPRILKAILEEVNESGVSHNQTQLQEAEIRSKTEEVDSELMQSLRQRTLERAILPLDEPTLNSLQHQATILHQLKLVPEQINVHDGSFSLQTRQNWTY